MSKKKTKIELLNHKQERAHLNAYRKLNREGQREADEHLDYLSTKDQYLRLPEGIIKKSEDAG